MTNEELIQDMKDHIARGEYEGYALTNEECEQVIKALEQRRWIPVSEKPSKTGDYLTTIKYRYRNETDYHYLVVKRTYYEKTETWDERWDNSSVIAWMPLPQPYKEEQDGENNTDND